VGGLLESASEYPQQTVHGLRGIRHCEERSDEAIQLAPQVTLIASLRSQ
jgi:hypothetical protein